LEERRFLAKKLQKVCAVGNIFKDCHLGKILWSISLIFWFVDNQSLFAAENPSSTRFIQPAHQTPH
jgi:hypothetical protein